MSARASFKAPSSRLHKPSGQAVVTLSGKDFYLGHHSSPQSVEEYGRLLSEWIANGRQQTDRRPDITVNEMLCNYLDFADAYYRKNGQPTKEPALLRLSYRPVRKLYGHTLAADLGHRR